MRYVGLDAHFRQSTICVLDEQGRKILSRCSGPAKVNGVHWDTRIAPNYHSDLT